MIIKRTSEKDICVKAEFKDLSLDEIHAQDPSSIINLQDVIKTVLNLGFKRNRSITVEGITIYAQKPVGVYDAIAYEVVENGKHPTCSDPTPIHTSPTKPNASMQSRYGSMWYQHASLSETRMEQILTKREEVRENRRHTGNSPLAT